MGTNTLIGIPAGQCNRMRRVVNARAGHRECDEERSPIGNGNGCCERRGRGRLQLPQREYGHEGRHAQAHYTMEARV